jgi:hypothetical protein
VEMRGRRTLFAHPCSHVPLQGVHETRSRHAESRGSANVSGEEGVEPITPWMCCLRTIFICFYCTVYSVGNKKKDKKIERKQSLNISGETENAMVL